MSTYPPDQNRNDFSAATAQECAALYSRPRAEVSTAPRPQSRLIASPQIQSLHYADDDHFLISFGAGNDRARFPFTAYALNLRTGKTVTKGERDVVPAAVEHLFAACREHRALLPPGTNVHLLAFGHVGTPFVIQSTHFTPRYKSSTKAEESTTCWYVPPDTLDFAPIAGTPMVLTAHLAIALCEACRVPTL